MTGNIINGQIQEIWKREARYGDKATNQAPKARALVGGLGASPENFEKLDAISCNLAYIFGLRMASDIIQNWAFAEQNSSGHDFETHRY